MIVILARFTAHVWEDRRMKKRKENLVFKIGFIYTLYVEQPRLHRVCIISHSMYWKMHNGQNGHFNRLIISMNRSIMPTLLISQQESLVLHPSAGYCHV